MVDIDTVGRNLAGDLETERTIAQQARPTATAAWRMDAGILAWLESLRPNPLGSHEEWDVPWALYGKCLPAEFHITPNWFYGGANPLDPDEGKR